MSKTTLLTSVSLLCLAASANTLTVKAENSADLYIEANRSVGNEVPLTPEQQAILDNMSNLEQKYLDYGLSKPVEFDSKNFFKARIGGWSWRDGLICVTDEGIGTRRINTWHAAIVAPQRPYVVAEAPGVTERVRFRSEEWVSHRHTVWHIGAKATSVQQDWNADQWAGIQVGKLYHLNVLEYQTIRKPQLFN